MHRASLAGAGLLVGVYGMATARQWLVWTAVGFLAVAFALRFAERQRPQS